MVAISVITKTRFAVITGGGTVITKAASKAAAAAAACIPACSARAAAWLSQATYGVAAATIDNDAAPTHGAPVSSAITDA
ncbi:Uncharacterised protein [Mycobacterium tuberculosis]|nr:Uncharacterised protein [Mycobacterium tuberculosis]CKP19889.1 Uncharacterised protein [Mycobacterium tuberculosis]